MDINNFNDDTWEEFIEWRPVIIDGIKTQYLVSNDGQVKNIKRNKLLSQSLNTYRYPSVAIYYNNGIPSTQVVHRLVAQAFIPNPENKPEVNHINGIKTDNRIENLEWCTCQENIKHAFKTGLKSVGSDCSYSIYSEDQINLSCKLLEKNIPRYLISELTNVDYDTLIQIKRGRSWKSISSKYNINYKERYKSGINIKYKKLKEILIELDIFDKIDFEKLLYSKHVLHKRKLLEDMEDNGYEVLIDSKLYFEFKKDYGNEEDE